MYENEKKAVRFADAVEYTFIESGLVHDGIGLEVLVASEEAAELDAVSCDPRLPEAKWMEVTTQADEAVKLLHNTGDRVIVTVRGPHGGFVAMSDFLASLVPVASGDEFEGDPVDEDASHGQSSHGSTTLYKLFYFSHDRSDAL